MENPLTERVIYTCSERRPIQPVTSAKSVDPSREKNRFCGMRTSKEQTSLIISVVWSAPFVHIIERRMINLVHHLVSKLPLGACSILACSISKFRKWIWCAVSFTVLSQTPRRPSYFQNATIAWAMLKYFGYRIASKSENAYKRPYHWARIPIKHGLFGYSRLSVTK